MHREKYLSIKRVQRELGVEMSVLNALVQSGLLGYTTGGMVSDRAISAYRRFGTQWGTEERYGAMGTRIMGDDVYDNLPPVESIGPQPPSTQTHARVAPNNDIEGAEEADTG